MAINATFSADFTDFVRGVDQADGSLGKLKASAGTVPPAFQQIASSGTSTSSAIGGLHQGLSQVDRILASLGVNIGPQVRALQELANVSGKTASQLGLIATGASVVAAGVAGWNIGRWISDWLGFEKAIGDATASLLGWGDASAEVAGAQQDVIDRAREAGHEVSTYGEALRALKEDHDAFSDSVNTSAHRVSLWQAEIRAVRAAGDIDNLKKDLEAQNGTLKQLSAQYGISVEALQHFIRYTKDSEEATKKHSEATTKHTETVEQEARKLRELSNWLGEREIEGAKATIEEKERMAAAYRKYLNQLGEQEIADAKTKWDAVKEHSRSALEETSRIAQEQYEYVAARTDEFTDHIILKFRQSAIEARAAADAWRQAAGAALTITSGASPLNARGTVTFDDAGNMVTGGGSQFVPGSGVTVFDGAPSGAAAATGLMVHPSLTPGIGRPLGTTVTMTNHINVVDTQDNLARSIGAQITRSVMQGTKFS